MLSVGWTIPDTDTSTCSRSAGSLARDVDYPTVASQDSTSATEKVSAHVGFYTKNGLFHPLIPLPTTELKIR